MTRKLILDNIFSFCDDVSVYSIKSYNQMKKLTQITGSEYQKSVWSFPCSLV